MCIQSHFFTASFNFLHFASNKPHIISDIMKKILIGSFIGAVILFIWSFLAWAILPLHLHTFMYTPAQDSVLMIMQNNNMESGAYAMPMADNRNAGAFDEKFQEESQKVMQQNAGKPMASIFYNKEGYNMGISTMIKGFLYQFIAALALSIILAPAFSVSRSFFGRWWLTFMAALFLNACGPLIQNNWMGFPWNYTYDMIVDNFLNWGIAGLWFAYFYRPAP